MKYKSEIKQIMRELNSGKAVVFVNPEELRLLRVTPNMQVFVKDGTPLDKA